MMESERVETEQSIIYQVVGKPGCWHRKDGPAYEHKRNGYKEWWFNNQRHRIDGPAQEDKENPSLNKWWFYNIRYSEKEYWQRVKLLAFI